MSATALICGVSGQDGAYLSRMLLEKGYRVVGTSRDVETAKFSNLQRMGISDRVEKISMFPSDFRSVLNVLQSVEPTEIYYLAGQSSVGLSFGQPVETMQSVAEGILNMLEAMRFVDSRARLLHAASSEAFGPLESPADERTLFRPKSPYGVAKATAYWLVSSYREAYGIRASNAILFNHESPLRHRRFVTKKIVSGVRKIRDGEMDVLELGNLSVRRDWGWADDYVEAMWRIVQHTEPDDFVIGTGRVHSLEEFVDEAFRLAGLDWKDHVRVNQSLFRPKDLELTVANPAKAREKLGWEAKVQFKELVDRLYRNEI